VLVALLALVAVVAAILLVGSGPGDGRGPTPSATGLVTQVVDGDTVDVAGVGRVRIIGIDTPEQGRCGYDEASRTLSSLVLGETVTLVPGAATDVDRYGRLLRYVQVDGVDVGLALLHSGRAVARYDSRDGYGEHPREQLYRDEDAASPDRCAAPP
jgi:endonuclease YncB( thermonuclease family)